MLSFDADAYLGDLNQETQKYFNKVCVATMMQVCSPTTNTTTATAKRLRDDLWRNATINISPADFPENHRIDRFGAARQQL